MPTTRTSTSHPIRVDWLPLPGPGAVGITFAPGKRGHSLVEDVIWKRDLGADLERLLQVERVDVLVCLMEDHELLRRQIPDLVPRAKEAGLEVLRLPIRDVDVPSDPAPLRALLAQMRTATAGGGRVVVHCAGGLGRSGVVAGCYLRALGFSAAEALAMLRQTRGPRCPETREQVAYVERWADVTPEARGTPAPPAPGPGRSTRRGPRRPAPRSA